MKEHFSMLIKKSLDASSEGLHFKQIVDFCKEQKWLSQNQLDELIRSDGNVYSITPKCSPTDPGIPELLALVERMGCAIYKRNIPKDHGPNPVAWSIVRESTMRDLKNAEYILIYSWGVTAGSYAGSPFLLEALPLVYNTDKMGYLTKHKFSWYPSRNSGSVNSTGRKMIESSGINGVNFNLVQWDHPKEVKGELWNLQFDRTMPACLLPVVVAYDGSKYYDEGPYFPPILRLECSPKTGPSVMRVPARERYRLP
jgi:hypothetical protein